MALPQKKLIPGILLLLMLAALAAPPLWWGKGNPPVIDVTAVENNHGPANIGQAKHMVKSALDALRPILPDVTADIEDDLLPILDLTVPDPKPVGWAEKQKAPLLIGQLKAIADPFYTHIYTRQPPPGSRQSAPPTAPTTPAPSSRGRPGLPTITIRAWQMLGSLRPCFH